MTRKNSVVPSDLLPWYVNHSRPADDLLAADETAQGHPAQLADWRLIQAAALSQPQRVPPAAVRQRLLAQTRVPVKRWTPARWLPGFSGLALAILTLVTLWNVMRPGIGLQWTVSGDAPAAFRIYRAPLGSDRFEVVSEVPARPGMLDYTFIDMALWPGQTYQYRVTEVKHNIISATIAASSASALPVQLAILLSSVALGLTAAYVLRPLRVAAPTTWQQYRLS